jgi:hypothetical protein
MVLPVVEAAAEVEDWGGELRPNEQLDTKFSNSASVGATEGGQ